MPDQGCATLDSISTDAISDRIRLAPSACVSAQSVTDTSPEGGREGAGDGQPSTRAPGHPPPSDGYS